MATEDNTLVEFTGINFSYSSIINTAPTGPIALNKGESYLIVQRITSATRNDTDQRLDLIGAGIKSIDASGNKDFSKPIVVNSGSIAGTWDGMDSSSGSGRDNSRDYHVDQLVGLETLQNGNEYIFVKGDGGNGYENIMLIASEANTDIYISGNTTPYQTLTNAGDFLIIEGSVFSKIFMLIHQVQFLHFKVPEEVLELIRGWFLFLL